MKTRLPIALFSFSASLSAQTLPNILWVTIEDTSPQFVGCYGNKDARTPVLDELASSGVRFNNAFSCGTVSSPSRSCIITGIKTYETGLGNHRSKYPLPEQIHGFPYYLQKEGYYTTNNSKTDYNVANAKEFTSDAWNESSNVAGWWNRKPGQPFFAVFNFMDSHQSRTMTNPYSWYQIKVLDQLKDNEKIAEKDFVMPPFYNDSPEMRKQFARVYNSIKLTDNKIGELLNRLEKDHLRDSTIIFFYADHGEGIPRGKTNGINLGYRVPFIIWFPEMYKHLSPWGKAGAVTDELIDFEDLAPTLISLADGQIPEYLKGRILLGNNRSPQTDHLNLSSDRSDNGIDLVRSVTNGKYMYSRNFMPFMPEVRYIRYMESSEIKQQMRKDLADKKLNILQTSIFESRPAEFLFDIEKDKWETRNLAFDPAYKELMSKMRLDLKNEILNSRDVMLLPEYEIGLISKKTTPYEFRLNNTNYPIAEIYDAAILSGIRSADIAKKQIELLKSSNKIVRYWAMVGLRSQSKKVLKPYSKIIENAMNDDYSPVAVTAAAVAFECFENKEAINIMNKFCMDKNHEIALMAINYLLYVSDKKPFIETIESLLKNNAEYKISSAVTDFFVCAGKLENLGDTEE
jgi:arylsulfatase A-like enzyme